MQLICSFCLRWWVQIRKKIVYCFISKIILLKPVRHWKEQEECLFQTVGNKTCVYTGGYDANSFWQAH